MDIDIHIVLPRQFEDTVDLRRPVAVIAGCAADRPSALIQTGDKIGVGLGHTAPALLNEHAEVYVDRPAIILGELLQRLETLHPDIGVELHMGAHMGHAVNQQAFQRRLRARVHILDGKTGFDRGDPLHVIGATVRRGRAAVEDARLVEMDVGFDQARRHQAAAGIEFFAVCREAGCDRGDTAILHADIAERRVWRRPGDTRVAHNKIKCHSSPRFVTVLVCL